MAATTTKNFVLVPGSFHGAWCYYKLMPLLRKAGATVVALDLPGHGKDKTPVGSITLNTYVDAVCDELKKHDGPSVLVGHSRAGIVISQVAERCPEKIDKVVYLAAFLIPDGEPMVATAMTDKDSLLVSNLVFNEPEGWHVPKDEALTDVFYHDCTDEDIALAKSLYCEEAIAPIVTPLQLSDTRFGSVKKVYIETLQDKAVTHDLQKRMMQRIPVDEVFTLDASHSPFFSKPVELAEILARL